MVSALRRAMRPYGQLNLGLSYKFGKGVDRDLVQAHMWFNLVACLSHLKPSLAGDDQPPRAGRPFERLRRLEILEGIMDAAPETAAGQLPEEALDRVRPEAGGRREVEGPAGMVLQPLRDGLVLVGGVVVQDGADLPPGGHRLVDLLEERDELLAPVAVGVAADGRPGFIGSAFRVRPSVWICVFSSIKRTTAWSGGSMYSAGSVAFVTPAPSATAIVPGPSSAGRMIRARRACFTLLFSPSAIASSRPRCSRAVPASLVKESNELNKPLADRYLRQNTTLCERTQSGSGRKLRAASLAMNLTVRSTWQENCTRADANKDHVTIPMAKNMPDQIRGAFNGSWLSRPNARARRLGSPS